MRIAVVGAGLMGAGMARCFLRAGHGVRVLAHRNRAPIDALVGEGAEEAVSLAALVSDCEVLFSCVSNARVIEAIAETALPRLGVGALWIDATTSEPAVSARLAAEMAERGAVFADAPVTGSPAQAEAGQLASLVGCAEEAFARVEAVIGCYSKLVQRFGGPGTGHAAKLLNNFVTQGTVALLAEAYTTARRQGIDWTALHAVMSTGAARSGTLEKMVGPALSGDYAGSQFSLRNAHKDIDCYRRAIAEAEGRESALALAILTLFESAIDAGHGERYVSALLDPALESAQRRRST
ncbi:MAG: NAD(P)-dependent oxidoreductase [Pseudomonadota bacterium]